MRSATIVPTPSTVPTKHFVQNFFLMPYSTSEKRSCLQKHSPFATHAILLLPGEERLLLRAPFLQLSLLPHLRPEHSQRAGILCEASSRSHQAHARFTKN